jgi:hypothetical protein
MKNKLRAVILKPSKYGRDGYVERFRRGFMPNGTLPHLSSMTPAVLGDVTIETQIIDEYVQTGIEYLRLLERGDCPTVLALAGVQSHQFQRALDLAAYAKEHGVEHCVIGGPHPMTCDTSMLRGSGISFSLSEAETVWPTILSDAIAGELRPFYGEGQRWQEVLTAPVITPPPRRDLRRYIAPMMGVYPARGCPYTCSFCSVIKIAGRAIRSQPVETTIDSLRAAKRAGVKMIIFTSDNFNKYPDADALLDAMIAEKIRLPFFVQCDTQIARQEGLVEKLSRAGCFQIFVGVESFSRQTLLAAHKGQNHPHLYSEIVRLARRHRILSHFSNIIGFPEDRPEDIARHFELLVEMDPDLASFYILTPIPGTEQYDAFLERGWIHEPNLDRYDGSCVTWRHPALTEQEWTDTLFRAYRKFYSMGRVPRTAMLTRPRRDFGLGSLLHGVGLHLFSRYAAWQRMHPMSGGVGRVRRDQLSDFMPYRRKLFGFELAPLPSSLQLSPEEAALNRGAKIS